MGLEASGIGMKSFLIMGYVLLISLNSHIVSASSKDIIDGSVAGEYVFDMDKPLLPKFDVLSVEVESIIFNPDRQLAIATLINNSNVYITPKLGVALMDGNGVLIAVADSQKANFLDKARLGPTSQRQLKLDFSGYINDFSRVKQVKLVFSVLQQSKENVKKQRW